MQINGWVAIIMERSNFRSRNNRLGNNKGSILVTVALLLPIFILVVGMVIDIGRAFLYKEELNKACMIAAEEASKSIDLEAAQNYGINKLSDDYVDVINEFFYRNYKDSPDLSLNFVGHNIIGGSDNPKYIEVLAEADVKCFFLKIISIDNITIHTKANGRLRRIK